MKFWMAPDRAMDTLTKQVTQVWLEEIYKDSTSASDMLIVWSLFLRLFVCINKFTRDLLFPRAQYFLPQSDSGLGR